MKKILSLIIMSVFIINSCFIVNATTNSRISGDDVGANAGESFTAEVKLTDNTGLSALSLALEYDNKLIELDSVENGEIFSDEAFSTSGNIKENPYKLNWVNLELSDSTSDGTLVLLKFDVLADCDTTSTTLKLSVSQAFDSQLADVDIDTTDINVHINSGNKKVKGITVNPPNKTEYMINETADYSGMTVKANYSDGSSADVTDKVEIKGFDSSKSGTKLVVVSYKGFSTAFPIKIKASENTFYLRPDSIKAVAGDTVEIPMNVLNNPGISGLQTNITFDSEFFTLTSVVNGDIFESNHMTVGGNKNVSPFKVFWENATAKNNYTQTETLGVVNLKVNENTAVGSYSVNIQLSNAVDCNLNKVKALNEEIMINVFGRKYLYADATGDGKVNVKDATIIQKYLAGVNVTIDLEASECEDDGVISILDATRIQKLNTELITDERYETYIYV